MTTVSPDNKSVATASTIHSTSSSSASFSKPKAASSPKRSFASSSFSSSAYGGGGGIGVGGGGGGGFFSLGESNLADRARRLKEERASKKTTMNSPSRTSKAESHRTSIASSGSVDAGDAVSLGSSKTTPSASPSKEDAAKLEFDKASLHEFDSLLISNQAGDPHNVFHRRLQKGFGGLRETRIHAASGHAPDAASVVTEEQRRYAAVVNFIDPTTKAILQESPKSAPPSVTLEKAKPTNLLQQQSMLAKRVGSIHSQASTGTAASAVASPIENVYDKLTTIFDKEYGSTLRSVHYKNVRTGETNTIRSLPVRPVLTRNGSRSRSRSAHPSPENSSASPTSANTPWGFASTAMMPVSDPSEWHTGPLCHVYIAACESVDHYRTKVRPSLKAFVSQLESSDSNTTANQQGGHSADYLIVYIPVGDSSKEASTTSSSSTPSTTKSNSSSHTGRLGFFSSMRRSAQTEAQGDGDDISSKDSVDSGDERMDMMTDESDTEATGSSINVLRTFHHLSKSERSLYKKIVTNFPNGKVCVLSKESLEKVFDSEELLALRVQEWNVFNKLLGQVIVNGFQDRIQRYKTELKRLDAQRASAATAAKNYTRKDSSSSMGSKSPSSHHSQHKPNPYAFNLGHFFLVKESLAFSYEQMQLPGEALLQYDEFRLYMPDLTDKEEKMVRKARRKSKALLDDTPSERLADLADAGDFLGFRKKIRTEYDLTAILDIMRRYLFARELSLLFRMEQPVEILTRCQTFVKVMHSIVLRGSSELPEKDQHERKARAATWVVQFSWDILCATQQYLSSPPPSHEGSHKRNPQSDEAVGAKLSDILEVARSFLLQLAEDHPASLQAFSIRRTSFPKDLQTPWQPWQPTTEDSPKKATTKNAAAAASPRAGNAERQFLMTYEETLTSLEKFEETYLKLCEAIIDARQVAKHQRQSARIQAEVGEYHVSKGDLRKAAAYFSKIVKVYRVDHWDRCHFWRVFRLAYCQRTTVEPTAYLKTLCSCFSPRTAVVAPKKALEALFDDLQRVIDHPTIGNARYSRLLFIETSLSLAAGPERSSLGRLLDQKEVEKRFCAVGEKLELPISIKSHLPGSIELTSVKLFAVTADTFKRILANGDAVQEEDAAKVLSVVAPIKLNPGKNDYVFEWSPPRPGQYFLSTIEILWKQGYFYYDSMDLQEPLLSIEVEPNEPTHSISLEPAELVPGQDQEVKVTFESGADFITSTKLILSGTDGILLIPPGEDPGASEWKQDWITDLEPFKPGEKKEITVQVRCCPDAKILNQSVSEDDSVGPARGLFAKALTTFVYAPIEGEEESDPQSVKASLEAFSPVIDRTSLSVESVETHWLDGNDRFLLSILLTSNSSSSFAVDEWKMKMASAITISSEMDLSDNLLQRSVCEGDQLSFAFECSFDRTSSEESDFFKSNKMQLKLCDEEGTKFWIDLPLDMDEFYSTIPRPEPHVPTETVQATLTLENNQGMVGEPLGMTFSVDTSDSDGSSFVYSIVCTNGPWLLGGKVSGIISACGSQTLSCVGVPVLPGVLDQFPTIALERLDSTGSSVPINVECQNPEAFQSMPVTQLNAIATPRFEER